ncbi:hypothetical protein AVEN_88085-1 [Araneus ventricosus]|uniref:Integrase catalytic domain-containing protein n=1 Tax=Araneus ventricosus TaxID=182803 RepID=A0A4Y2NDE9_ARAVE|nr:hypothetical protein AVEN_88085-1 [Araneus ventricosus]
MLAKKSDGSFRLVAELRKLNSKTIPDNFPMPNLNDMMDMLSGAKFLTTMDLTSVFTRWYAEAYPTPDIQGSTVALVLIDFISRHGLMQTLYSDRGSNFLSDAMMNVYAKLGIPKYHTLAFNPQGNELVERLNKTLVDSVSHLVSEKQEDWCQHVPLALMAFKSAYHRSIQETPDFLVYGRDPVMPYDLIFSDPVRSYSDTPLLCSSTG